MSDVDDELLALLGNGSSSSRSASPDGQRRKRRRPTGGSGGRRGKRDSSDDENNDDDDDDSELDAEGSEDDEDDEGNADEPVNPYRLDGIYKDEDDRERLLQLPELEREAELAARRDEITQRRQKADLKAMVRNQQMAGKSVRRTTAPKKKAKQRKLKKASTVKRRKRSESDEDEAFDEDDDDDDEEDEDEEEEESDYGSSKRRGSGRARKAVGKTSSKSATLQKLKQSRAKAQRRRQGGAGDDDESSGQDSESEYDAEEAEALWRRKKERERRDRGDGPKREQKASREQERLANHGAWHKPTLGDVNAARLRRDHFTRLLHRPDWMAQLAGKFARINYIHREQGNGRVHTSYRLVRIVDCRPGEKYYEIGANDQLHSNAVCDMRWGDETMRSVPLQFVSNSEVTEQEYGEWSVLVDKFGSKIHRNVPSREETQDQGEDLQTFINRPFTEQDINQILQSKKQARQAYHESRQKNPSGQPLRSSGHNGDFASAAGYNEILMAQMNEKHRKADRERIVDAERRNALQAKLAAQRIAASHANTPANGTPTNGLSTPASPVVKAAPAAAPTPLSLALAAVDVDVDLGDF